MCGFAGEIRFDRSAVDRERLRQAADALSHRGPDAAGEWLAPGIGLAHRRLSILDLSPASNQPMHSEDGHFTLAFNGEIYNYKELRAEMEARGQVFRTSSDTEVLLRLFARDGAACLPRLNGMFAFAAWDQREETLTLARDRFGIKPLYLFPSPQSLHFASEIRAFPSLPEFRASLNLEAVADFLAFQVALDGYTWFRGVEELPPGTWRAYRFGSPHVRASGEFSSTTPAALPITVELVRETFHHSVRRTLQSDVEVGCFLSAGLDSGSIASAIQRDGVDLRTFSCGFALADPTEWGMDESDRAASLAAELGTRHRGLHVRAEDFPRVAPLAIEALEDPRAGNCVHNYLMAEFASADVKVVLSGLGGDELFAGYPWKYRSALAAGSWDDFRTRHFANICKGLPAAMRGNLFRADRFGRDFEAALLKRFENRLGAPAGPPGAEAYLRSALAFDQSTFLRALLSVDDKLGMHHSIETRFPFLDLHLHRLAASTPPSDLLDLGGDSSPASGKKILRAAFAGLLPEALLGAPKQGFVAPDALWFRRELRGWLEKDLFGDACHSYELLHRSGVRLLLAEHFTGTHNHRNALWALISLELWLRRFQPESVG